MNLGVNMDVNAGERIMVGLSGGVDSAVAALLLLRAGARVEGLFMKNWEEDDRDGHCSATHDLAHAKAVARHLGIPLYERNFAAEYWDHVFEDFLAAYRVGLTPNPDVLCNREIKFHAFLEHARALGADRIATGHYARVRKNNDGWQLRQGRDADKDQTYFLHLLGQNQLSQTAFPLGEITKVEVRRLAREAGLPNHDRKDSTGICFIGERRFRPFLQKYVDTTPGAIESVDRPGVIIGRHQGLAFYTIGQRQGLGIGGVRGADERPWYVAGKRPSDNALLVAQGQEHPALYRQRLRCVSLHWIGSAPSLPLQCQARIRHRQAPQTCHVQGQAGEWQVDFDEPQWAVAPGQSVVFYIGEHCLGGGVIAATSPPVLERSDAEPQTVPA